MKNDIRMGWLH